MWSKINKAAVNYKIKYLCIAYVDHIRSAFQFFFFLSAERSCGIFGTETMHFDGHSCHIARSNIART